MEAHPAAELFPMMPDEEVQALADDIAANGLNQRIVVFDGEILDGRNRYRACEMAGVEPKFEEWSDPGCGPVAWVVSQNIRRRHLTATQRAALAVDLLPELEAEAKQRQDAARRRRGQEVVPQIVAEPTESRQAAADLVQVNRQYVSDAKKIAAEAPELLDQMRSGEIGLQEAKKEAKRVVQRRESSDPERWTQREEDLRAEILAGRAVVVNMKADTRLIGWAEQRGLFIRVDRSSEWGNPFHMGPDGSRDQVCEAYAEHYLPHKPSLKSQLHELKGRALGCWCSPERCHADDLAARANEA